MTSKDNDILFMRRALQLASNGLGLTASNPMVGAVIVGPQGNVLGEGFHRCYGGPHAEVNAINSVSEHNKHLLAQSTMYVTLEPCSHFGKTPPCANLLVNNNIKRVFVASSDPFEKVDGRGLDIMMQAGIEVLTGLCETESKCLNARFFTAHTKKRPFITLKWAQSSDGFMDSDRSAQNKAFVFSTPVSTVAVHKMRSNHMAIGVGSGTYIADAPRLDVRHWSGSNPRIVIFDRSGRCSEPTPDIEEVLSKLYGEGITSIMIEGGPTILNSFINKDLWDFARVEVSPVRLHDIGRCPAPSLNRMPFRHMSCDKNDIYFYSNNDLVGDYFVDHSL